MINPTPLSDIKQSVCAWLQAFSPQVPLIAIPVYNAIDDVLECVHSLLETVSGATPLLILDDASSDPRVASSVVPLLRYSNLHYARLPANGGFSRTLNFAFEWGMPHDVVIVNSDVIVPNGWLERMQAAAYAQTNIATATPLTNHGTLLSVPFRNQSMSEIANDLTLAEADKRIQQSSLRLYPVIPTAVGHLIYFKRAALDTVGIFDAEVFSPGYGEEVDLSQRMVMAGFCHVAADDVLVFHKGSRSFGQESEARRKLQAKHESIIHLRYPWYARWIKAAMLSPDSPLAIALDMARSALLGYEIAIDVTCLNGTTTGTQVGTLELVRALALADHRFGRLTLIVGDGVPSSYLRGVGDLVNKVVPIGQLRDTGSPLYDLIHRPFQVVTANDLRMLRGLGRRFIVSHLDCISYSNPSYALTPDAWLDYRRQTEKAFATADGITFVSEHARDDARHKGLQLPRERACVIYNGVDHQLHGSSPIAPAMSADLGEQPFLLVLGTNFKHKNRAYTIKVFHALAQHYAWPGHLIMAGPHVASGGSEAEEAQARSQCPELDERIHDLGEVTESEKIWLLTNAKIVLYPSLYEGFGLIPFEAAAYGTPTLTFRATALNEVLGDRALYLEQFDPLSGAKTIWRFLTQPEVAQQQVNVLLAESQRFTWTNVAQTCWDFYGQVLRLPLRGLQGGSGFPDAAKDLSDRAQQALWSNWLRRFRLGVHVLLTNGPKALRKEIRQYIQWRRSQF